MTTTPRTDDEQGQAKAVKEDKLAEIQLRADLAKVMATHEGQRVIRYLLCKADVFPIESPA
ncbi:MAG: hypothetical protein GY723_04810, partial [bacterium]|nr:hypothetical protein [bacterium]